MRVNTFILDFRFVMSLVSSVQNTLLAFISLRYPKWWVASHFILFYFGDFRFCVCLRACVCAWVQSLDWDHRRIKHQFSVCVVSRSINTVDCAQWHSVQNPHLSVWLRLITVLFSLCHQLCLNSNPLCSSKSPTFVLNNLMVLLKFWILLIPSCAIHTLK